MYSMLKKIITEKDLHRQIRLLEQLLNQPQITAKELAQALETTERTIFADLQVIRTQLPPDWQIQTDSNGIQLRAKKEALTNSLWEIFLSQSIVVELLKRLLVKKELAVKPFLRETGVSFETLKRHARKVNQQLTDYQIQIELTTTKAYFSGAESSVRIFYQRLLVPFTHNNYFFEDYAVHESHYFQFLRQIEKADFTAETEEIFGVCWFFINTIRSKAGCPIERISFKETDPLFTVHTTFLKTLYQKEGVYLQQEELFFVFFCYLESWNYNNHFGAKLKTALVQQYQLLAETLADFVADLARITQANLAATALADNLLLLLLKYQESPELSAQFEADYQGINAKRVVASPFYSQNLALLTAQLTDSKARPSYLLHLMTLLQQQALFAVRPETRTFYFLFQGEPAWKAFLEQELADYLGKRIVLKTIEVTELAQLPVAASDLILSNFPLDQAPLPVFYLSTVPTKNELRRLAELTFDTYF